jgi:hypothetical protein
MKGMGERLRKIVKWLDGWMRQKRRRRKTEDWRKR